MDALIKFRFKTEFSFNPQIWLDLEFWGVKIPKCTSIKADENVVIKYKALIILLLELCATQTLGNGFLDKGNLHTPSPTKLLGSKNCYNLSKKREST